VNYVISICSKKIGEVWFGVAHGEQSLFSASFGCNERDTLRSLLCSIPFNIPFQAVPMPSAFAESIFTSLRSIYDGKDAAPNFSLETEHLSAFYRGVLDATFSIPVGYVTSYGSIAKAAGGSPRAVGHVMATNPFAPIVPCHRVVASDFALGGYGGGLDTKIDFLAREKRGYQSQREIPVNGKTLTIFPVEWVFKKLKIEK
jgi:O-6-methylguanine DNA methyltransferase